MPGTATVTSAGVTEPAGKRSTTFGSAACSPAKRVRTRRYAAVAVFSVTLQGASEIAISERCRAAPGGASSASKNACSASANSGAAPVMATVSLGVVAAGAVQKGVAVASWPGADSARRGRLGRPRSSRSRAPWR